MIVKSSWRRADGLEEHLLRTDTNETVRIRHDLFRGADDLHAALRLMDAIARTNPRVVRSFVHVVISPHHEMTDADLAEALAMVEAEHGLSSVLRAVVEHLKGLRATHVHVVYPVVDPATGTAARSHDNFERDELVSRRLEQLFGERVTPGPRIEQNIAELRRRGLDAEADQLAPYVPVRHEDPLSRADRQQASRLGVKAPEWSARAFALFEGGGLDIATFAGRLEAAGLSVARGDRAMLLVDDATGYSVPLTRLLRREAKAGGRPLIITEDQVAAAFSHAAPFGQARDAGLERARTRAEHDLATERRTATTEAALDSDVEGLAELQRRARKAREDEESRTREAAWATLRARREAIQALYQERDAVRRRRVDRAFRAAKLLDVPELRRLAAALAVAGVLMTGGTLALALAAGVVAAGLLPTRASARAVATAARSERAGDAARRRSETDAAYREAKAAAAAAGANGVRFTFDRVPKADRLLAGRVAAAMLQGGAPPIEVQAARDALGPEVVAGLTRIVERGSPLQVRRLIHWYHGVAPSSRENALNAALQRHAGRPNPDDDKSLKPGPAGPTPPKPKGPLATQSRPQRRRKNQEHER